MNLAFGRPLTTAGKSGGVFLNHPGMDKPTVLRHRIPKFDYPSLIMSLIPCVSCNPLCGTRYGNIYTPVHMDCMCYVSGCNLHGGYNMMLSMVYLGRTLKLMQNGLRTTGIGYNTVKMHFMCM